MREILEEVWKDIEGYEGLYQVSNRGRVKHLPTKPKAGTGNYSRTEHILRQHKNNNGYFIVDLYKSGQRYGALVHRLVAIAFLPSSGEYTCVNHKDEVRENNCVENLEWCTQKYNMNYGTVASRIGKANSKPVMQLDKSNVLIKIYPSIIQAERETGISDGSIWGCLHNRRKSAGGFLWEYAV